MIGREKKHDSASYYRHALRCDNQAGRSPPGAGDRSGTYEPGFRRSKELLSGEAGFYRSGNERS